MSKDVKENEEYRYKKLCTLYQEEQIKNNKQQKEIDRINKQRDKLLLAIDIAYLALNDFMVDDCQDCDFVARAYDTLLRETSIEKIDYETRKIITRRILQGYHF